MSDSLPWYVVLVVAFASFLCIWLMRLGNNDFPECYVTNEGCMSGYEASSFWGSEGVVQCCGEPHYVLQTSELEVAFVNGLGGEYRACFMEELRKDGEVLSIGPSYCHCWGVSQNEQIDITVPLIDDTCSITYHDLFPLGPGVEPYEDDYYECKMVIVE